MLLVCLVSGVRIALHVMVYLSGMFGFGKLYTWKVMLLKRIDWMEAKCRVIRDETQWVNEMH